jgi:hypothetical protein
VCVCGCVCVCVDVWRCGPVGVCMRDVRVMYICLRYVGCVGRVGCVCVIRVMRVMCAWVCVMCGV